MDDEYSDGQEISKEDMEALQKGKPLVKKDDLDVPKELDEPQPKPVEQQNPQPQNIGEMDVQQAFSAGYQKGQVAGYLEGNSAAYQSIIGGLLKEKEVAQSGVKSNEKAGGV